MADVFNFKKAVVIDMGQKDSSWIKVQLTNGEEAFFYPDDEETVSIKDLKPGLQVVHRELRRCKKPGQTRWLTNAHSIEFQPSRTREYLNEIGKSRIEKQWEETEVVISTEKTEEDHSFLQSKEPLTTRVTFDGPCSLYLRRMLEKTPFSSNKHGASRLVAEIVSEAKCIGLMDKYYKIEEGAGQ